MTTRLPIIRNPRPYQTPVLHHVTVRTRVMGYVMGSYVKYRVELIIDISNVLYWRVTTGWRTLSYDLHYKDAIYIPNQGSKYKDAFAWRDGKSWRIVTGCFEGTRREFLRRVRRDLRDPRDDRTVTRLYNARLSQIDLIKTIDIALLK